MDKVSQPAKAQQQTKAAASGELTSDVEALSSFDDHRASTFAQLKLAGAIATSPPIVSQRKRIAQLQPAVVQRDIAEGSEELKPGGQYKAPQQQDPGSIIKLYGEAFGAQGELWDKTRSVAAKTKGEPSFPPGLKDLTTAKDKIKREYGNDVSKIVDLVRSTIVYPDVATLLKAMPTIESQFTIVRRKNKFMNVTPSGYRDINMNVEMSNGHIGELQLNITEVLALKSAQHKEVYEEERKYADLYTKDKGKWPPEAVDKIDKLEAEWRVKFDEAMSKASPEDQAAIKGIKEIGIRKT